MNYLPLFTLLITFANGIAQPSKKELASQKQTVQISFESKAGNAPLELGKDYQNATGETFNVRSFKYYISNIQVQYAATGKFVPINLLPHLVNEADSLTKNIYFTAPAGNITTLRFLVGVDRLYNVSGAQTGDLDPAKGMFWVWNTGYIVAKLEGVSPQANTPGRQYTYDVGGYKNGEDATRQIELQIQAPSRDSLNAFVITADVLKWFTGAQTISIAAQPMCHAPGKLAMQIADNFPGMFSIKQDAETRVAALK